MHGLVDDRVRHLRHELAGDLLVDRPLDVGEHPARDVVVVGGQALDPARVLAGVAHEARHHRAHGSHGLALVPREGLVGVLGDRLPESLALDAGPAPLGLVTVPVAHHEVEEARLQERPAVHPVLRAALAPLLPQVAGGHDLGDALVAGRRVLVQGPDRVRERLAELPERRVVGHDREARAVEGDPDGLRESADDERGRRVGRGGLVDGDCLQLAVLPLLGQDALGVLLQLPEGVAGPVRGLHGQAFGLEATHLAQRGEAAGLGREVEHRDLDRRRPGLAEALSEPEAPRAAPVELLGGDDRSRLRPGRARGRLRRGLVGPGRGRDGAGHQTGSEETAGRSQSTSAH